MAIVYEGQSISHQKTRLRRFFGFLPLILTILFFLTGCVNYDVGINFQGQHRGTIVQRIELKQQLIDLSADVARDWVTDIEARAQKLGGTTKIVSPGVVSIAIPFSNGDELVTKFNSFFNPNSQDIARLARVKDPAIEQLYAEAALHQSNLLFLERNRLSLAIDLRAFGLLSQTEDKLVIDSNNLIDLKFSLDAPWGTKNLLNQNSLAATVVEDRHRLVWQLQPGKINRIEAVFWYPSTLGIGAIVITLLMLVGYTFFPSTQESVYASEE